MGSNAAVVAYISTGEASWGTTTVCTRKIHGIEDAELTIDNKVEAVKSKGWYGPGPIAEIGYQRGVGSFKGTLTYEEGPILMNGLFTAIGASTSTGGAAPYTYPYTAPISSTQACYTYTMEWGTTGAAYRAPGTIFNGITISGEAGGLWKFDIPILAKQIVAATSGLSTGPTDRTVNAIRMADTNLYIDAFSTGTLGTTIQSAMLIDFELKVDMKRHLKQFAGSVYPGNWGDAQLDGELKMTLEYTSTAKTLIDSLMSTAGSSGVTVVNKQIRIVSSVGASCSAKSAYLDFAGALSEPVKLWGDREGNQTVELTFTGQYTTAFSNWFQCSFQNGTSSTT